MPSSKTYELIAHYRGGRDEIKASAPTIERLSADWSYYLELAQRPNHAGIVGVTVQRTEVTALRRYP